MGRRRRQAALEVYIGATLVGTYLREASGATRFRYVPEWIASPRGFAISRSLPLTDQPYTGAVVDNYFEGLLPDVPATRERLAAREQAASADPFDLLSAIGRDCVGALRLVPEGEAPGDPRAMNSRPLSQGELAHRLAALGAEPLGMADPEEDFRLSIAGAQDKTAFLLARDGNWHLPLGSTPTSHIFKPPLSPGPSGEDLSSSPWNEWFCLKLCTAFGLPSAEAEVHHFNAKPVLVVRRFDRLWYGVTGDPPSKMVLYRLPQEDLCQAMGVPPNRKYEVDGGPGFQDVMTFLKAAADPRSARLRFFAAQLVFWLLGAVDGHAKNFSIALSPGGFELTPLYDVLSLAPYYHYPRFAPQKAKLAMAVGDNRHYRIHEIQPRHFHQSGRAAGLDNRDIAEVFEGVHARVEKHLDGVVHQALEAGCPTDVVSPIAEGIRRRIARVANG